MSDRAFDAWFTACATVAALLLCAMGVAGTVLVCSAMLDHASCLWTAQHLHGGSCGVTP